SGAGNIELLPRPPLSVPWGTLVNGSERVSIDSTGPALRGVKEFDWLLTPRDTGVVTVPPLRYPYFDPEQIAYRVSETAPLSITVREGTASTAAMGVDSANTVVSSAVATAPFDLLEPRAAAPSPWPPHLWMWLTGAGVASALLLLLVPPLAPRAARRASGGRVALAAMGPYADAAAVARARRAWLDAIGERVPAVTRSADAHAVARALRHAGARPATVDLATALLTRADGVAFGGDALGQAPSVDALCKVLDTIDGEVVGDEAAAARATAAIAASLLMVTLLGVMSGRAEAQDVSDPMARGRGAYATGRFDAARAAYLEAAAATPGNRAAWRNAGLAAWRMGDTATVVWAWQRALRLDPGDDSVRALLDALPAVLAAPDARVPRVRASLLERSSVVVAGIAVSLAVWWRRGRRRWLMRSTVGLMTLALGLGVAAVVLARRTQAPGLAVALRDTMVRRDPTMTAEPVLSVPSGDVIRIVDRRPGWLRVRVDATHDGWVPERYAGVLDLSSSLR
nr:SH3 domain-containing protein [Gemmatimonadaceae bacterium]